MKNSAFSAVGTRHGSIPIQQPGGTAPAPSSPEQKLADHRNPGLDPLGQSKPCNDSKPHKAREHCAQQRHVSKVTPAQTLKECVHGPIPEFGAPAPDGASNADDAGLLPTLAASAPITAQSPAGVKARWLFLGLQSPGFCHFLRHGRGHKAISPALAGGVAMEVDMVFVDRALLVLEDVGQVENRHSAVVQAQ